MIRTNNREMPVRAIDPSAVKRLIEGASLSISSIDAQQILAECRYDGQRPVNDDRVLLLAGMMEHQTFLQNSQLAFCRLNGRLQLVNGQHRLSAVDLCGLPQVFRIEIYDCRNAAEVDAHYCRFDQPGGIRTLTQVSRSLGLHDEAGGLRPATAALLLKATPLLMIDLRRVPPPLRPRETRDLDAKRAFALGWKPEALAYQGCLDQGVGKYCGRFRNAGVFAIALATLRHQREQAEHFWSGAIRGDGLGATDPRQTLRNDFMSRARTSHEFDLAEVSAFAWNAWIARREIKILKVLGGQIRLSGTPYGAE